MCIECKILSPSMFSIPYQIQSLVEPDGSLSQVSMSHRPHSMDESSLARHSMPGSILESSALPPGQTESPDSGHREMSSDSLSQSESVSWFASGRSSAAGGDSGLSHGVGVTHGPEVVGQGSLPASRRPDFNLPLRSTNPFSPASRQDMNANVEKFGHLKGNSSFTHTNPTALTNQNQGEELKIITPLPLQDASGNRLQLNTTPRIDPPPRVIRRSSPRTQFAILSPDSNGNTAPSSSSNSSSSSDHSIGQFTPDQGHMAKMTDDNLTNESKELNMLMRNSSMEMKKNSTNTQVSDAASLDRSIEISPLIMSTSPSDSTAKLQLSFSDDDTMEMTGSSICSPLVSLSAPVPPVILSKSMQETSNV